MPALSSADKEDSGFILAKIVLRVSSYQTPQFSHIRPHTRRPPRARETVAWSLALSALSHWLSLSLALSHTHKHLSLSLSLSLTHTHNTHSDTRALEHVRTHSVEIGNQTTLSELGLAQSEDSFPASNSTQKERCVCLFMESSPRAPTRPENIRKPARLTILEYHYPSYST